MMTMSEKRDLARQALLAAFEGKDFASKVAFVAMVRPIPLDILVRDRESFDIEFGYSIDDMAGMARSDYCTDPVDMSNQVMTSFAGHEARLKVEHAALISTLSAQTNLLPRFESADDEITWPSSRDTARLEDMSPKGHLRVTLDESSDVLAEVFDGECFAHVEFCAGAGGGGKSPRTRRALIALMVAIEEDNVADVVGARHHPRYGDFYT